MTEIAGMYAIATKAVTVLWRQQHLAFDQVEEGVSLGDTVLNGLTYNGSCVSGKVDILIAVELSRREDGRYAHDGCSGMGATERS